MKKKIVILGGGMAGLTAALYLAERNFEVTILERAPFAGGLASSWPDERDPDKAEFQYPMKMVFPFYANFHYLMKKIFIENGLPIPLSKSFPGFYFHGQFGPKTEMTSEPKGLIGKLLKKLPAPLCAAQILWDFEDMGILDKLSTIPFHLAAIIFGEKVAPPISDDYNFYGLLKRFWMTEKAIKSFRKTTYSITNLSDADQVGAKFFHLFYLSYLRDKNAMGCRMVTDNYSPALIEPFVKLLEERGVKILLNRHIDDIVVEDGRVKAIAVQNHERGIWLVCPNCGLKFLRSGSDAFCPKCGKSWEISNLFRLWPGLETIEGDYFISALQPHQFAKILKSEKSGLPPSHPLLEHPYFRALGQFKGAHLSFSRVYYGEKFTNGYNLTGLDRDYWILNGAMDISSIMPRYKNASVFDTLHDDGEVLEMYDEKTLKEETLNNLEMIFSELPKTDKKKPIKHLLARIYPDVLYHRPHPRLHSRFLPETQRTPVKNLFMAGDWTDEYQLGLEAAVKSGVKAANIILEKERRELAPIFKPSVAPGVRLIQKIAAPLVKYLWRKYEKNKPPRRG